MWAAKSAHRTDMWKKAQFFIARPRGPLNLNELKYWTVKINSLLRHCCKDCITHHLCIIWECYSCPCSSVFCFNSEANFILLMQVLPFSIIFTVVLFWITVFWCQPVPTTGTRICRWWCLWLMDCLFCKKANENSTTVSDLTTAEWTLYSVGTKLTGVVVML
jgi:hypothetical protein